ncbi:MAG: [FeFe] hydrogenase H-cluster maturation GTPase HydF [Clostridia bacterium]|nr:[FeFe] hydrogenase H-cluster maturation GTPase HydF [Clostridia bacterium]
MAVNELSQTPNALRTHIGIFGRRNSGKSSLLNALTGQPAALVSDVAGTTTDPVWRAMEVYPIGPCVWIDTAGFDDEGELGAQRVQKTEEVLQKIDAALLVVTAGQQDCSLELHWLELCAARKKPVVIVVNKADLSEEIPAALREKQVIITSAKENRGIDEVRQALAAALPKGEERALTEHLGLAEGDHVLLVAPQDIEAPKGRLILPQVQTIRDLLDRKACVSIVTEDRLAHALTLYKQPPVWIITDSQVFDKVEALCPPETKLTSFSILMARFKGDLAEFIRGAAVVDTLKETDKVLILEACTHNAVDGDIGRVKIPGMLRKKAGAGIEIEVRSGNDIPADLTPYQLVIHCGGCMFNRAHMMDRVRRCQAQGVPITNYGVFIAKAKGILLRVSDLDMP